MDGSHTEQSRNNTQIRWKQPVETATFYNSQNKITGLEGRKSNRTEQQDERQIISDVYPTSYSNPQNNHNHYLHNTRNKTIAKNQLKKSNKIIVQNINVDKASLKIHGLDFASFSAGSDSGKSDFDEEYYKNKPQPIHIDKNLIVTVNQNEILPNPTRISKIIRNTRDSDLGITKDIEIETFPNENGISNVPTHSHKSSISRDELLMAPKSFRTTKDKKEDSNRYSSVENNISSNFTFDTRRIPSENKTHKTYYFPEKSPNDKTGAQKIQTRTTNNIKQPVFLDNPCHSNSTPDELIFEQNKLISMEPKLTTHTFVNKVQAFRKTRTVEVKKFISERSSGIETGASKIQTSSRNVNKQPTVSNKTNFSQSTSNELITTGPCILIDTLVNKLQTSSKIGTRNCPKPPNDTFSHSKISRGRQSQIFPNVIPSSSNRNKSDGKQTVQTYGTVHDNNTADLHIKSDVRRNSPVNTNQSNDNNLLPVDKGRTWMRIFDLCLCCFSN